MHQPGIYSITNTATGKRYVGSSRHIHRRWTAHLSLLRRGIHHCGHLQHSWNAHAEQAFRFEVLLVCGVDNLLLYEQIALDAFAGELLNSRKKANNREKPPQSDESRRKKSLAMRGRPKTKEHIEKVAAAQRGRRFTAEHRQKLSDAKRGRPGNPQAIEAMAAARRGRPMPAEAVAKRQASRAANRAASNSTRY